MSYHLHGFSFRFCRISMEGLVLFMFYRWRMRKSRSTEANIPSLAASKCQSLDWNPQLSFHHIIRSPKKGWMVGKERKRWSREVIPPIRGEAFLEEIVVRGHFSTLGSQTRCSGEVDNHGPGNHGLKCAIITKRSQRTWRSWCRLWIPANPGLNCGSGLLSKTVQL